MLENSDGGWCYRFIEPKNALLLVVFFFFFFFGFRWLNFAPTKEPENYRAGSGSVPGLVRGVPVKRLQRLHHSQDKLCFGVL